MASTQQQQQEGQEGQEGQAAGSKEREAREARADAKEGLVHLAVGAKERRDHGLVTAQATLQKIAHPFDKEARRKVDEEAERKKAEVSARLQGVRDRATQEAQQERVATLAGMGHPVEGGGPEQAAGAASAAPGGVNPSLRPESGSYAEGGQGQQAQQVREGGAHGNGAGAGGVDTKSASSTGPVPAAGTDAAPPPPQAPIYHNPFH